MRIGSLNMFAGSFAAMTSSASKGVAGAGLAIILLTSPALALDGTTSPSGQKLSPARIYKSAREALRVGVDDLNAGDAQSSVKALTYAADGGEALAQWKLEARLHLRRRRSRAAQRRARL
jgi:hypothetical protein